MCFGVTLQRVDTTRNAADGITLTRAAAAIDDASGPEGGTMGVRTAKLREYVDPTLMSPLWLIALLVLLMSVFSIFHELA